MMTSDDQQNIEGDADRQSAARSAMDKLNENNRILKEARMLPENRTLTEDEIKDVVAQFTGYCAENNIPHRHAARQCGYTSSVISSWSSGTYKGDVESVTRTINTWLERDSRRRESRRPKDYVNTQIAEDVRTTVYLADKRGCMATIVVPAGAGKTMVAKALVAELRGLYIYADEHVTAGGLYLAIAIELGWDAARGSRSQLLQFIVKNLTGTRKVVFIDEAQNCGKHLGCLRSIHDRASVPIIMLGTDEIMKHVDDRSHGRGQFSSRCIHYNALELVADVEGGPGREAGRDLFSVEEIEAFFQMKKIRINREALKLVWAISCLPSYGTLRFVEQILDTALDANPELSVITRDDVVAAVRQLKGKAADMLQMLARRHVNRVETPMVAKAG